MYQHSLTALAVGGGFPDNKSRSVLGDEKSVKQNLIVKKNTGTDARIMWKYGENRSNGLKHSNFATKTGCPKKMRTELSMGDNQRCLEGSSGTIAKRRPSSRSRSRRSEGEAENEAFKSHRRRYREGDKGLKVNYDRLAHPSYKKRRG